MKNAKVGCGKYLGCMENWRSFWYIFDHPIETFQYNPSKPETLWTCGLGGGCNLETSFFQAFLCDSCAKLEGFKW